MRRKSNSYAYVMSVQNAPGAEPTDPPAPGHAAPATALGVLVVDDEPAIATQLAQGLGALGHGVTIAHSAAAALGILAGRPDIAVVVSDIRMEGDDGLALAADIQASRPDARAVEVVLITGHATVEDAAAAVRSRVSDFLRKPFRLAEADAAVGAALARAAARRDRAAAELAQRALAEALRRERAALEAELRSAASRIASLQPPVLHRDLPAISHALRTPLNAIAGGADLMAARGVAGDPDLDLLRAGVRRTVEAIELVEELHRLDRTDLVEPAPVPVALDAVLARVAARCGAAAARAGVELRAIPAAAAPVQARPDRLVRLLELCVASLLEGAPRGAGLDMACGAAAGWALATLALRPAPVAAAPDLPDTPDLPESGTALSRTQETLHFSVARRLAERQGGRLTSWNGPGGAIAIRLALPA